MTLLQDTIAAVLRATMARRQMSHGDVARASGMSKSTVTRILTGQRPASVAHLLHFAVALQTRPSRIILDAEKRIAQS